MAVTVEINGKKVTFELRVDSEGEVQLDITHVDGEATSSSSNSILWIDKQGELNRMAYTSEELGLSLNKNREIKKGEYF